MAGLQLSGVGKVFGAAQVLGDIDLTIADGEFVVFVGPSGCGKSTLLRIVAGLEQPSAGEIRIDGKRVNDLAPAQRGVAMVFQSYALYPHMNVYDNMAFALKLARTPRGPRDAAVRAAAKTLEIENLLARRPRELSGGQRQRVAIGRAIVRQPRLFLFDEPLSNLDAALRVHMRHEFVKLHADLATTMIYVTHDQVEAMTLADRIVVLNAGRIEQIGTPGELYQRPDNIFVAGFLGSPKINLLPAEVVEADAAHARVRLAGGEIVAVAADAARVTPGEAVTLGVRPEHFEADAGTLAFTVRFVESLGAEAFAYGALAGADVVVRLAGDADVKPGQSLRLGVAAAKAHLFGPDGRACGPARSRAASG
jgi:ABC-type sugar transport system ATPase subunit